jgi:Fe-S cluster biogenesis protein NfuA
MDMVDRVAGALERSVLPSVIARGGEVRVVTVEDGVATFEVSGSPGAVLPLVSRIEDLIRADVPDITGVRIVGPAAGSPPGRVDESISDRVRRVLDTEINPAIAAHRGHVTLVDVDRGWAHIRLESGCQGCSLAEVTVRQALSPCFGTAFPRSSA